MSIYFLTHYSILFVIIFNSSNEKNFIRNILNGNDTGKRADIVILNAAAGIFVGGMAENIEEGISTARETIGSGAAMNILVELAAVK